MTSSRDGRGNPSLLPDATYFALQRMITSVAVKQSAGGLSWAGEVPTQSSPPGEPLPGGAACRLGVCMTNRDVETAINRKLGWLHAITEFDNP